MSTFVRKIWRFFSFVFGKYSRSHAHSKSHIIIAIAMNRSLNCICGREMPQLQVDWKRANTRTSLKENTKRAITVMEDFKVKMPFRD